MSDDKLLAIITARGGSKGLPGKNVRPLGGKPLIAWTVEAAVGAESIERVVVTSDSEEILAAGRAAGAETIERPAELAGDLAQQEDAVKHAMDVVSSQGASFSSIVLLAPTNPLRDAAEIDSVAAAFRSNPKARAMVTVVACDHYPPHSNVLPDDLSLRDFFSVEDRLKNRQELPQYYRPCGSVCLADWDHFLAEGSFMTDETYGYVTTRRNGLDIDEEIDFLLAESYLRREDEAAG